MPNFNNMPELNIGLLIFAIVITLFILLGCLGNQRKNFSYVNYFVWMIYMNLIMLLGEAGIWIFEILHVSPWLIRISCFFSFGGGTVMAVLYVYCILSFVENKKEESVSYRPAQAMAVICGLYLLFVFLSIFNGAFFQVNEQGCYVDGPLHWVSWIIDPCMLLFDSSIVIYYRKTMGRFEVFVLLNFTVVSLVTSGLQYIWYPVPELLACTLSLILMFMLFYWEQANRIAKNEKEILEKKMLLAISQIQPHFLYNTLSTIAELCQSNPQLAEEVTNQFALYLRHNLENIDTTNPVDFHTELAHVKTYLMIEKIRFQDDLQVNYDIGSEDFFIPALTIQPLVENAVKHGMMGSESVCTIKISSCKTDFGYQVCIEDDGCGFDPDKVFKDGKRHIGIESVTKRLKYLVGGRLTIQSVIGQGTRIIIELPGKENL